MKIIHPRTFCCDFHDRPEDVAAHLAKWEAAYGKHENGAPIKPPEGWRVMPFLDEISGRHREFWSGHGWLRERTSPSTNTPLFAHPAGRTLAFAVPDEPRK